jgi:hypothetical protein
MTDRGGVSACGASVCATALDRKFAHLRIDAVAMPIHDIGAAA